MGCKTANSGFSDKVSDLITGNNYTFNTFQIRGPLTGVKISSGGGIEKFEIKLFMFFTEVTK
ncbi:hypothetical protein XMV209_000001 [Aliiroseovarius sp. xm-v-209]|nr:hypothetical protein [Aliiroseovarius sp. xm-m-314]NRP78413.1 hypothetical protein [Aliiroseovarius sp. xm-v-209]